MQDDEETKESESRKEKKGRKEKKQKKGQPVRVVPIPKPEMLHRTVVKPFLNLSTFCRSWDSLELHQAFAAH